MILVCVLLFSCGCASYLSYEASRQEVIKEKSIKTFVTKDGMGGGVAIDVNNLDVILKHPWRQFAAGLTDAATAWGVSQGISALNKHEVTVNISGTNNTVTISD